MAEGAAVLRQKVAETASRLEECDQSVSYEGNLSWLSRRLGIRLPRQGA